jgi:hypothetical protein
MDNLIKTIAVKHGVAVGRDDPILILHTLNDELHKANATAMAALLDRQKAEMEALAKGWNDAAKARAERILNAALAASTHTMQAAMAEGATGAVAALHQEVRVVLGQIEQATARTRGVALWNLVAATLVLAAAVVMVLGMSR